MAVILKDPSRSSTRYLLSTLLTIVKATKEVIKVWKEKGDKIE